MFGVIIEHGVSILHNMNIDDIANPTHVAVHLIQENNLPSIGCILLDNSLNLLKIEPFTMMFVVP